MNTSIKKHNSKWLPICMALGPAFGVALAGVFFQGNIGTAAGAGLGFGLMVGVIADGTRGKLGLRALLFALLGGLGGGFVGLLLGLAHGAHYAIYGPRPVGLLFGMPFKSEYLILAVVTGALGLYWGALSDGRKAQAGTE